MSKRVIVKREGGTTLFYFANLAHHPNREAVQDFIKLAIYQNRCSYGNVNHINNGIISVNFNLAVHDILARRKLEKELKTLVESQN